MPSSTEFNAGVIPPVTSPENVISKLWMPFTAHRDQVDFPPAVIERGDGIYLYDRDGKRYIDAVGAWWVSSFGHCNPRISGAVKAQLDKLEHVLMAGFVSEPTLALTELLGKVLPPQISKIFYSDNGSTAVEAALKIALQYHALRGSKRCGVVALGGGYHGDTLGAVSVGSIPAYHGLFHKRFKEQYFTDPPYCFRCPADKSPKTCGAECMNSLARILYESGDKIAACIFEPMMQGAAGLRIYPAKVVTRVFELCRRHGVVVIADECATGLGRTGEMFACGHAGITPDIICFSKGLTAGYLPMAATAVSEEIYGEFKGDHMSDRTLNHGHTFTGNPLSSSAAAAVIRLLIENDLPKSAAAAMNYFSEAIKKFNEFEHVSGVRSLGFAGAFEIVKDKITKEKFPPKERMAHRIARKAQDLGLVLRPLGDVIYFMPPFNTTADEIDEMFDLTRKALVW